MDIGRWQQVKGLLEEAMDLDPADVGAWLAQRCPNNPELRHEVEALLNADEQGFEVPLAKTETMHTKIGPYRIEPDQVDRDQDRGVLAWDEQGQRVWVKTCSAARRDPQVLSGLKQEVAVLEQLDHPGIVKLVEWNLTANNTPYVVYRYVDGVPILDHVAKASPSLVDRLLLMRQVCAAVAHAHGLGQVHGVLGPSRILVTPDGPIILGFGRAAARFGTVRLTGVGMRLHLPAYISPEAARGQATGAPADVYALGLLLYQLVCEQPAYVMTEALSSHVRDVLLKRMPVVPSKLRVLGPPWTAALDALTLKTLAKDPNQRYPDGLRLLAALEGLL